ncbi:unnamed protein product, partial [Pylaiella littoralis]
DLRKVTALSRNFFTNPSGAGGASASGGGRSSGKARGSGRKYAATQPSIAGTLHGNAFPTAPSKAAANRARSSGTGGHAQGHYGPVFSRTSGGRGTRQGGGGPAGGAGRGGGPGAVLSANEKAVI